MGVWGEGGYIYLQSIYTSDIKKNTDKESLILIKKKRIL